MAVLLEWLGVIGCFFTGAGTGYLYVRAAVIRAVEREELALRRAAARRAAEDRDAARRLEAVATVHCREAAARRDGDA